MFGAQSAIDLAMTKAHPLFCIPEVIESKKNQNLHWKEASQTCAIAAFARAQLRNGILLCISYLMADAPITITQSVCRFSSVWVLMIFGGQRRLEMQCTWR
jgi:hypothetical protein